MFKMKGRYYNEFKLSENFLLFLSYLLQVHLIVVLLTAGLVYTDHCHMFKLIFIPFVLTRMS